MVSWSYQLAKKPEKNVVLDDMIPVETRYKGLASAPLKTT